MKKTLFWFFIFNLILLLFLTVSCEKQIENKEQTKSLSNADLLANQELDQRFVESMAQMDIEKLMSCFWDSPDVVFVDYDGNVFRGSDEIRKAFEQFFAQFESLSLGGNVSHIRAGNSVFAFGTSTYTMQMKDGTSKQVTQRWSDVRGKIGGQWFFVLDHVHFLESTIM
jgi:uncharacterized protein (TIGR02246 family)